MSGPELSSSLAGGFTGYGPASATRGSGESSGGDSGGSSGVGSFSAPSALWTTFSS